MDSKKIEYLDSRYPVQVEVSTHGGFGFMSMREAPRTPYPTSTLFKMTFTLPESIELAEGIALMYYQFDKFMKERYGVYVQQYQDSLRARRIDNSQTGPATDTGG